MFVVIICWLCKICSLCFVMPLRLSVESAPSTPQNHRHSIIPIQNGGPKGSFVLRTSDGAHMGFMRVKASLLYEYRTAFAPWHFVRLLPRVLEGIGLKVSRGRTLCRRQSRLLPMLHLVNRVEPPPRA